MELVANPSILFCDEPTSGLDSRSSMVLLRVLRRVAQTGRTVLCTIHQPSAQLFSHFDRLILLHKGGTVVYDGPLGVESVHLVNYFETLPLPATEPPLPPIALPPHTNPATWMLDLIGAGTAAGIAPTPASADAAADGSGAAADGSAAAAVAASPYAHTVDFGAAYLRSDLRTRNEVAWEKLLNESSSAGANNNVGFDAASSTAATVPPSQGSPMQYARSSPLQFRLLLLRLFTSYYRDLAYNGTRFFVLLCSSIVFGLLWFDLQGDSAAGAQSQLAALYFSFYFVPLLSSASILPVMYRWKEVWGHEILVLL